MTQTELEMKLKWEAERAEVIRLENLRKKAEADPMGKSRERLINELETEAKRFSAFAGLIKVKSGLRLLENNRFTVYESAMHTAIAALKAAEEERLSTIVKYDGSGLHVWGVDL